MYVLKQSFWMFRISVQPVPPAKIVEFGVIYLQPKQAAMNGSKKSWVTIMNQADTSAVVFYGAYALQTTFKLASKKKWMIL